MATEIQRRHIVSDDAVEYAIGIAIKLNKMLIDGDSQALENLLRISVSCDDRMGNCAVVNRVATESSVPHYTVSMLGVINGLVDDNLAIAFDGYNFCVAVRDSHPDSPSVLWSVKHPDDLTSEG